MAATAPPLTGVRVLEVGVFIAGPFAAMQLADLGAEVTKVEHPAGGDPLRAAGPVVAGTGVPFAHVNRNKRSVALDLRSPAGREAFLRLAAGADVVIENLRPGAMRRLGLGGDDLRRLYPYLIYAAGSGWGQDGPLAALPGLDIMAQARSGLMSVTGAEGGAPAKVGVPVCDLVGGLFLALAVTAALRERDRTGQGQAIDVSLLESGVSLAVWEAARYFATGEVGAPAGFAHQSLAPYQAVRAADGHLTVGAVTPRTWAAFCGVLGLERLLDDVRYATAADRHVRRRELVAAIEAVTMHRSTAELVGSLERAGVPCAPISDYAAVLNDAHLTSRGYFWDAFHPVLGRVRQLGSPMRLSRTPAVRGAAGPLLGADTRPALRAAGYADAAVDDLVARRVAAEPEAGVNEELV